MDPRDPLLIAANAAEGFGNFQCRACADKIKTALKNTGQMGQEIEIRGGGKRGFMICLSYNEGRVTITQAGYHIGVLVRGFVFDNLHPVGLELHKWLMDFDAIGGVIVSRTEDF